jgi:hypothetical protein
MDGWILAGGGRIYFIIMVILFISGVGLASRGGAGRGGGCSTSRCGPVPRLVFPALPRSFQLSLNFHGNRQTTECYCLLNWSCNRGVAS